MAGGGLLLSPLLLLLLLLPVAAAAEGLQAIAPANPNHLPEESAAVNAPDGVPASLRGSAAALDPCTAPALTGPCRASFPRWFYLPANGTCFVFVYGGCRGNGNNFQSRQECLSRCHPRKGDAQADLAGNFFSSNELAFGILLLVFVTLLLVTSMDLKIKLCQKKAEVLGMPLGQRPKTKKFLLHNV
ncbi:putative Kunitz-type serine protease inhibitor [Phaenicophaeus curvirostris]|uniref:putative Kunitz-type serine protease inhibitor n=1 Tax=Phaenicophaeus curvirostris TaxID=33595 RepID=UPI0037F0ADC8